MKQHVIWLVLMLWSPEAVRRELLLERSLPKAVCYRESSTALVGHQSLRKAGLGTRTAAAGGDTVG